MTVSKKEKLRTDHKYTGLESIGCLDLWVILLTLGAITGISPYAQKDVLVCALAYYRFSEGCAVRWPMVVLEVAWTCTFFYE